MNGKHILNGKDAEANRKLEEDDGSGDAVQRSMGYLGPWQVMVCLAISLIKFPVAWHQLAIVFMAPKKIGFNCTEPGPGLPGDQCHALVNGTQVECTNWEYDKSVFSETVISQVGVFLQSNSVVIFGGFKILEEKKNNSC